MAGNRRSSTQGPPSLAPLAPLHRGCYPTPVMSTVPAPADASTAARAGAAAASRTPRGSRDSAAAADLREPQHADERDRSRRLRHGLHPRRSTGCAASRSSPSQMTLRAAHRGAGYPAELGNLTYDHDFVMRGLVVDKDYGNIFKTDRFNHVGRCYHGRQPLDRRDWQQLYRDTKIRVAAPRFAWIDTLFALPEAALYAQIIEVLEGRGKSRRLRASSTRTSATPSTRCTATARSRPGCAQRPRGLRGPATPSWARRCTSCARAARSSSCSPTRCSTTPTW